MLAASAPPTLRLVLAGRGHPSIRLERLRYGEGLGELGAAELAFTRDEIAQSPFAGTGRAILTPKLSGG